MSREEINVSTAPPRIRSVTARAVDAPISRPVKNAFGVIRSAPLVLIDVETDRGITGRSYIFGYARLTLKPLVALIGEIGAELAGKAIAPFDLMAVMDAKFRLLGWQGLVGMAVSGPRHGVLGCARPGRRISRWRPCWVDRRGRSGPMTATARSIPSRTRRICAVRSSRVFAASRSRAATAISPTTSGWSGRCAALLGPDIALMLDFNQSLDPAEASRRIDRLAAYDLHWIEEPVAAENLQAHAKVRATSPISIQSGENWWFPRGFAEAIAAGASDFIMPDLMKVGGVTGWLRVAGQAEAASIPMSSHLFAEASAHLLAVTPTAHWLEVLDLARAILTEPIEIVDGTVTARGPGFWGCHGTKRR